MLDICPVIKNKTMQTELLYLTLFFSSLFLQAQNTIEVNMSGFTSNNGKAVIGFFVEEETFLRQPLQSLSTIILDQKSSVTFSNIPDGIYAISVYHDENDNGKIDLIMGMMPKEDTGTSNNPNTFMGPPKWKDAKFEIKNGEVLSFDIKIK